MSTIWKGSGNYRKKNCPVRNLIRKTDFIVLIKKRIFVFSSYSTIWPWILAKILNIKMWLTFIIPFFLRINQEISSHIPPANPADLITLTNYTSGKTQHAFPSQSQEIFPKYDVEYLFTANCKSDYICIFIFMYIHVCICRGKYLMLSFMSYNKLNGTGRNLAYILRWEKSSQRSGKAHEVHEAQWEQQNILVSRCRHQEPDTGIWKQRRWCAMLGLQSLASEVPLSAGPRDDQAPCIP